MSSRRNGGIISTRVMTITPEEARKMLEKHESLTNPTPAQRKVHLPRMLAYSNAIKKGDWTLNHQGILISRRGAIMDGQHRLHAIVHADKAVDMMVTIAEEDDSELMDSVDIGRPRNAGLVLQLSHGVNYGRSVAGAIRTQLNIFRTKIANQLPPAGIFDIYQMQCNEIDRVLSKIPKPHIAPSYIVGPISFYATSKPKKAMDFLDAYINLENLSRGSPPLTLHKTIENWRKRHHEIVKMSLLTIHALNRWDGDEQIVELQAHDHGADWLASTNPTLVRRIVERCQ